MKNENANERFWSTEQINKHFKMGSWRKMEMGIVHFSHFIQFVIFRVFILPIFISRNLPFLRRFHFPRTRRGGPLPDNFNKKIA